MEDFSLEAMQTLSDCAKRKLKNALICTESHNRVWEEETMWSMFQQMEKTEERDATDNNQTTTKADAKTSSDESDEGELSETSDGKDSRPKDKKEAPKKVHESKREKQSDSNDDYSKHIHDSRVKCDKPDSPPSIWHDDRVRKGYQRDTWSKSKGSRQKLKAHMDDENLKKSTRYTRQLQKLEEKDENRWAHSGYKELYPDEFDSDRSASSSSSESSPEEKPVQMKKVRKEPKTSKKPKHPNFVKKRQKEESSSSDAEKYFDKRPKHKTVSREKKRRMLETRYYMSDDEYDDALPRNSIKHKKVKNDAATKNIDMIIQHKRRTYHDSKVANPPSDLIVEKLEEDLNRERTSHGLLQQKYVELATQYNELVKQQARKREKSEKTLANKPIATIAEKEMSAMDGMDTEQLMTKKRMSEDLVKRYNELLKRCQRKQNLQKLLDRNDEVEVEKPDKKPPVPDKPAEVPKIDKVPEPASSYPIKIKVNVRDDIAPEKISEKLPEVVDTMKKVDSTDPVSKAPLPKNKPAEPVPVTKEGSPSVVSGKATPVNVSSPKKKPVTKQRTSRRRKRAKSVSSSSSGSRSYSSDSRSDSRSRSRSSYRGSSSASHDSTDTSSSKSEVVKRKKRAKHRNKFRDEKDSSKKKTKRSKKKRKH